MRTIDMQTWSRRKHFETFNAFDFPYFGMTAQVDITNFYTAIKQGGYSISTGLAYLVARVANEIPEFRYRIRGDVVIEHAIVHPSTTILMPDDLFSFCTMAYIEDFEDFTLAATEKIKEAQANLRLEDEAGQDDLLFMSVIPWISFTRFMHPLPLNPPDSVPRFAWGKFYQQGDRILMPFDVQGHHALMDGLHVGRYFMSFQEYLDAPERFL